MRIFTAPLFFVAVMAISNSCKADGNSLLSECNGYLNTIENRELTQSSFGAGHCIGLIQGMSDAAIMYQTTNPNNKLFCLPQASTAMTDKLVNVVVNYLINNPKILYLPESLSVMLALKESFPCHKSE